MIDIYDRSKAIVRACDGIRSLIAVIETVEELNSRYGEEEVHLAAIRLALTAAEQEIRAEADGIADIAEKAVQKERCKK